MRAAARIVAEADGDGGTRLAVLHGEPPLLPRRTGSWLVTPETARSRKTAQPVDTSMRGRQSSDRRGVTVHLVGGAAGPLCGDDLRIDVEVGPDAWLDLRSVAASLALPGRAGLPPSRLVVRAAVEAGGMLRWQPEPVVAVAGCRHETITEVTVAAGGRLIWRDDLVCGRFREPAGDLRADLTVRYAGAMLYRHELAIGPSAPGWSGVAILGRNPPAPARERTASGDGPGDGRATGTVVLAGTRLADPAILGGNAALMPLAGPGVVATAVGADSRQVRAALDPVCDRAAAEAWPGPAGTSPLPHAPAMETGRPRRSNDDRDPTGTGSR